MLAAAGLLDGRRCTTHWMYAAGLARYCPSATVDPDVLYVDAGPGHHPCRVPERFPYRGRPSGQP